MDNQYTLIEKCRLDIGVDTLSIYLHSKNKLICINISLEWLLMADVNQDKLNKSMSKNMYNNQKDMECNLHLLYHHRTHLDICII